MDTIQWTWKNGPNLKKNNKKHMLDEKSFSFNETSIKQSGLVVDLGPTNGPTKWGSSLELFRTFSSQDFSTVLMRFFFWGGLETIAK